jgi:hypothetical protein
MTDGQPPPTAKVTNPQKIVKYRVEGTVTCEMFFFRPFQATYMEDKLKGF